MTVNDIVNSFNEGAMFNILIEEKDRYKIEDLQLEDIFWVSKKEWYEKIKTYFIEENLENKRILNEMNENEIDNMKEKIKLLKNIIDKL